MAETKVLVFLLHCCQTLFFVRIFADIVGRFLPRLRCLALETPGTVLLVAFAKLSCE